MRSHNFTLPIPPFFIDATPVTNAAFRAFLAESGYWPSDAGAHNFLLPWSACVPPSSCDFPPGWGAKPVTYVAIEEARAYCSFYGKRLPHEWEWQYAAQGGESTRAFPWGDKADSSRHPPLQNGTVLGLLSDVGQYASGASPFGMLDAVGLVWEWTDVFIDSHAQHGVLRGTGCYRPLGSQWYFPLTQSLHQHGHYLMMSQGMDRRGTIGFRCVVDAEVAAP